MDKNKEYFLYLLSCQINKKEILIYDEEINWKEIYKLAKIHNLIVIIFSAINKIPNQYKPSSDIYSKFKKDVLLCVQHNVISSKLNEEVINTFIKEKLEHIPIKGYILKAFYPSIEYRSMSDIDILIKKEDRERSHKILQRLGYENFIKDSYVWNYKKNKSHIEMHTELIEEEIKQDIDFKKYFSNPWEYTVPLKGDYSYTLNKDYHFIYLLVHIAKHFYGCGCGVRMIMDIAVYINQFKEELDWNYIWQELEKLDLKLLGQNILVICNKWFDTKLDFEYEIEEEFYNKLSESILTGGTFGFYNSNFRIAEIRNNVSKNNENNKKVKLKILKQMLFPSYEELIKLNQYSFLNGKKYLIGFAWIYRGFYQLKSRGTSSIGYLGSVLNSENKVKEQSETMNKLGL